MEIAFDKDTAPLPEPFRTPPATRRTIEDMSGRPCADFTTRIKAPWPGQKRDKRDDDLGQQGTQLLARLFFSARG